MPPTAQQTAQAPQPAPPPPPASELSLEEMTRVMDVARTLRKERTTAERELDREGTIRLLRQKLREAADIAGDPVTDAQIEAAIRQYYENLHAFQPPQPGWETTLAKLYVRRTWFLGGAAALAAAGVLWLATLLL